LEIDPNNKEAYYLKGSSLDKIGRYSEAIASFDKAITIDPNYALAWQNKGLAQYKLKQFDEAIASFNKAKELGYTG
jgi:tetratricopeptide (TPR) repeat protein